MQLLDGKMLSGQIRTELAARVAGLKANGQRAPHLAAVLVGHHGASETYVAAKVKACGEAGFQSSLWRFDERISENDLLVEISRLNERPDIDGILIQLPLPGGISPDRVILRVDPSRDVDGFHPLNIGRMVAGLPGFIPATPHGIMLLLAHYQVETSGKQAVVLGRSGIVGTPVSILLSRNAYPGNCTVTLCHSRTPHLKEICRHADILVAAMGKPGTVTREMVKEGAVVVDVGTTRVPDDTRSTGYRLAGDVCFDEVSPVCSYITPVPGGIGPMTIAALLKNTFQAAVSHHQQKSGLNIQ
ncbi:MAG TPA: tetrahydrofolate dehydrogenase/cyclohydrolase catalytic domain-containing protein [Chitinophagaceae bacterium]|nr:tetrahydrofolate dehydrogenase/cyclohydrolase catalytic domain-containing protein [Chitinophagaceae bacterium]